MEPLSVRIKRLDPNLPVPEYKTAGAVGFDIAVREGGILAPGERRLFKTGLVVQVPPGYALLLASRSSNAKKGLTMANGIGVIDQDFCGPEDELRLALYNIGTEPYDVQPYERLAQGLIVPALQAEFVEGEMEAKNRGGFGTTG